MNAKMLAGLTLLFIGGLGTASCASSPPPKELQDARTAYHDAQAGAASEVAPVELLEANRSLQAAERAYEDDPDARRTRDLAYVAERRARIAQVHAAIALNEQTMDQAEATEEQVEGQIQQQTEGELRRTRSAVAARDRAIQDREQQIREREQVIHQTGRALEQERQARTDAERTAAAALESLREVAQVREESRGVVITLSGSVLFASGESTLLPIAQQKLDELAAMLKDQYGGQTLLIEGHTDSRGSARRNEELSLLRAQRVRDYLVSKGLDANAVRAVGLGSTRPVADNGSAEGRANNRRVEIVIENSRAGMASTQTR